MSAARIRREARRAIRKEAKIDDAFDAFMDGMVASLVALGVDEVQAVETIFTLAEHLASEELLPEFPDDTASAESKGAWLVQAYDFGLPGFLVAAVTNEEADAV